MTALATIEPIAEPITGTPADALALNLPPDLAYPDWVATGRSLATRKVQTEWMIADWLTFGRTNFAEQIELELGTLGMDNRDVKRIEKTAQAFPPALRDPTLSFDHHAHVADLPQQEALPLLKQAKSERWTARKTRVAAMLAKVDNGLSLPREDDPEYDALMACIHAWNRAPATVREDFAEMVADAKLEVIEP